jgi:hypothetical protein
MTALFPACFSYRIETQVTQGSELAVPDIAPGLLDLGIAPLASVVPVLAPTLPQCGPRRAVCDTSDGLAATMPGLPAPEGKTRYPVPASSCHELSAKEMSKAAPPPMNLAR